MAKKILIFVIIVVVIGLIIYFVSKQGDEAPEEAAPQTLGGTLYQSVGARNPAENLPELNPFEAGVNPYSDGYKNPFGQ